MNRSRVHAPTLVAVATVAAVGLTLTVAYVAMVVSVLVP